MITQITMRRHHLVWWVWQLTETNTDKKTYLIAQGAQVRKRRAIEAADLWHTIYMRTRGLY
jgi:hypothetical protein